MERFKDPRLLKDYLSYLKSIKGLSSTTIKEYRYDIRSFIEFQITRRFFDDDHDDFLENFDENTIDEVFSDKFIDSLDLQDLYAYLSYLDSQKGDQASTRARKISALKSFYHYLYSEIGLIKNNPSDRLSNPKIQKRQPVYLTLEETQRLLDEVSKEKNDFLRTRDLAIIFTFLTTGMRLSELVSIDLADIKKNEDTFKIIGKGNKERTIYLTQNCKDLIFDYIEVRNDYLKKISEKPEALFISTHKKRMCNRAVQATIDKYLEKAGFDTTIYSTHKLRHTAATLMYKYGKVDIRALKDILGHENISTTQIYTHVDDEDLKEAVNKNPLSNLNISGL